MDNLFLNVFPAKADSVNGSARITDYPELSRALKSCAALRAQFLPYFTDGTFIGNCVLAEPAPGATVCAYVLPDRLLTLVLNEWDAREVALHYDLAPWVPSPAGTYTLRHYGEGGALLDESGTAGGPQELTTPNLGKWEMGVYEFQTR